jgi:hypothetical protein
MEIVSGYIVIKKKAKGKLSDVRAKMTGRRK